MRIGSATQNEADADDHVNVEGESVPLESPPFCRLTEWVLLCLIRAPFALVNYSLSVHG